MRKLISNGLAVFVGIVSLPAPMARHAAEQAPAEHREDPRLQSVRTFFQQAGCPASSVAQVFIDVADIYDLDWRLLPSISFVESTGGKSARNNNLFGWDAGRAAFSSLGAGIHAVAFYLATSSLYKNKSLDEVLATYNPDLEYARKVKLIMERIAPSE